MTIQLYDFRSVSAVVGSGSRIQFHTANPRRVSILVSGNVSVSYRVCYAGGSSLQSAWISAFTNVPATFTYRDCGPVMQQPIFIEHNGGVNITFTVTEVYRIGDCKPCV